MAKSIKLRISPKTGDPTKGIVDESMHVTNRPKIDQDFDIRDRLAELVGKGNALSPDDKAAIYGNLTARVGKDKAMKIMNHAYIFNQRSDVIKLPLEERLKAFYTIGSNDKDVNDVIVKSKSLGYGAVPGFRQSSSDINQQLTGQVPVPVVTTAVSPEIQKRVMLQVRK